MAADQRRLPSIVCMLRTMTGGCDSYPGLRRLQREPAVEGGLGGEAHPEVVVELAALDALVGAADADLGQAPQRVVAHARVLVAERALEQQPEVGPRDVRHRRGSRRGARRATSPRASASTAWRPASGSAISSLAAARRRNAASGDVVASSRRARSRGFDDVERADLRDRAFVRAVGLR